MLISIERYISGRVNLIKINDDLDLMYKVYEGRGKERNSWSTAMVHVLSNYRWYE